MQQPLPHAVAAPRFYLTGRQRLGPGSILLAIVLAAAALACVSYALSHGRRSRLIDNAADRSSSSGSASKEDDKDDPNQVDEIVLGDAADAPAPARKGDKVSPVHPFVIVQLPRFGDQFGLIPNSPAGHLLFDWLAAFNQASYPALLRVLPNEDADSTASAQLDLRHATGGFELLSAKEITPGILVFRLRDQTPLHTEALGTLQLRPDSSPPTIASFSLRDVPQPARPAAASAAQQP